MDIVNEYFKKKSKEELDNHCSLPISPMVCKDGFIMSVQANQFTYCIPRESHALRYEAFEVGFPSEKEDLLMPYAEDKDNPTDTVYGFVPVDIILKVIEKHGGIDTV